MKNYILLTKMLVNFWFLKNRICHFNPPYGVIPPKKFFLLLNPLALPCAGAYSFKTWICKYNDTSPGEVKGLISYCDVNPPQKSSVNCLGGLQWQIQYKDLSFNDIELNEFIYSGNSLPSSQGNVPPWLNWEKLAVYLTLGGCINFPK